MSYRQQYNQHTAFGKTAGWYKDGKKSYTAEYDKNGKQHGTWTHWYPSGQVHVRRNYEAGKYHGLTELWFENGQMRSQNNYQHGVRHGVARGFDETGVLLWEHLYDKGRRVPNANKRP